MSVELQWYNYPADEQIDEDLQPLAMTAGTTYTVKIKNIGDKTAANMGFFLSQSTMDPLAEIGTVYPSTRGVLVDLHEVLTWGKTSGQGYILTQAGVPETFTHGHGDSSSAPISLTKGSPGTDGDDELAPDEEVLITIALIAPPAESAHRKYVTLDVVYTEE